MMMMMIESKPVRNDNATNHLIVTRFYFLATHFDLHRKQHARISSSYYVQMVNSFVVSNRSISFILLLPLLRTTIIEKQRRKS